MVNVRMMPIGFATGSLGLPFDAHALERLRTRRNILCVWTALPFWFGYLKHLAFCLRACAKLKNPDRDSLVLRGSD